MPSVSIAPEGISEQVSVSGEVGLKPRRSQRGKQQWSMKAVRGEVTSSCLWNSCKAITVGMVLVLMGAGMATLGYYAQALIQTRMPYNLTVNNSGQGSVIIQERKKLLPVDRRSFHLNNLSYVGPIVMGIGGFIIVAACVMTFEARDSASKIVPARFRKTYPDRSRDSATMGALVNRGRHSTTEKGVGTALVFPNRSGIPLNPMSRQAAIANFMQFSRYIQKSIDSSVEPWSEGALDIAQMTPSRVHKSPSAPTLYHPFTRVTPKPKTNLFQTDNVNVTASNMPSKLRRSSTRKASVSTQRMLPRHSVAVDQRDVQKLLYRIQPFTHLFSHEEHSHHDEETEEMEEGEGIAAALGYDDGKQDPSHMERIDSETSLAMDLHFPDRSVRLKIEDESRIRNQEATSSGDSQSPSPMFQYAKPFDIKCRVADISEQSEGSDEQPKSSKQISQISESDEIGDGSSNIFKQVRYIDDDTEDQDSSRMSRETEGCTSKCDSSSGDDKQKLQCSPPDLDGKRTKLCCNPSDSSRPRALYRHCDSEGSRPRLHYSRSETSKKHLLLKQHKVASLDTHK